MARARAKKPGRAKRKAARPRARYHHGNLGAALVAAAIKLVEEGGPERVSVREAARRAGVSSAAPFRHFPSRAALMTAVAEEAMRRFRAEIAAALEALGSDHPLDRLRAIGVAYLRWALRNPAYFQVISARRLIDFEGSAALGRDNAAIRAMVEAEIAVAQRRGLLRLSDVSLVPVAARALVYGLARMYGDGHFPQWDVAEPDVARTAEAVLDLFIAGLAR